MKPDLFTYLRAALLLAPLLAAGLLLPLNPSSLSLLLLALLLVLLLLLLERRYNQLQQQLTAQQQSALGLQGEVESLERLVTQAFPIWQRQIETSISHGMENIDALGSRFAAISEVLRAGVNAGGVRLGEDTVAQEMERDRETLQQLLRQLEGLLASSLQTENGAAEVHELILRINGQIERLRQESAALLSQGDRFAQDIDQVLVALQFQDRVSQILSHLVQSLQEVAGLMEARQQARLLGQAPAALQVDELLERMRSRYTTLEQHHNHAPDAEGPEVAAVSGQVNFF